VIEDVALRMGLQRDIAQVLVEGIETLSETKLDSSAHTLEATLHKESETLILTAQPTDGSFRYFQFNAELVQVYP
jgi:hypothetical protein